MSYQVGFACYADLASAGAAACSQFQPVTSVTGGTGGAVLNATCQSSDSSGVLTLKIITSPINGDTPFYTNNTISPVYNNCTWPEYVDAGLTIFVALLGVYFAAWGVYQLYNMLHWSRADGQ